MGKRKLVRERAKGRCEYCLIHESDAVVAHQPDHVVAVKHGGKTTLAYLAWSCYVLGGKKNSATKWPAQRRKIHLQGTLS
jgi:hypothetical protein